MDPNETIQGWDGTGFYDPAPYTITLTGARFCFQEAAAIDIKPGSDKNPVSLKGKGMLPVAVLTSPEFDAASIDVATVSFEGDDTPRRGAAR